MLFQTYPLGQLQVNCYLLSGDGKRAVIIDPGENGAQLAAVLERAGLTLDAICLTHCHYDHIGGLTELVSKTGAPVYMHPEEYSITEEMSFGLLNVPTHPYPAALKAGGLEIAVYHTPGHSPGSVCLLAEDKLLTGDTLFFGSCGRIDLAGGSWEKMLASLGFLAGLDGDLAVYPGHGEASTLSRERKYNPYMQEASK